MVQLVITATARQVDLVAMEDRGVTEGQEDPDELVETNSCGAARRREVAVRTVSMLEVSARRWLSRRL